MKFFITLFFVCFSTSFLYAETCVPVDDLKPRMLQILKEGRGAGTGILLDDQHFLTAGHVIDGLASELIWVKSYDDPWELRRADLSGLSEESDLALLTLEKPLAKNLPLIPIQALKPNQFVRFFGFAFAKLRRFGVIEGMYKGTQHISIQSSPASYVELKGRTYGGDSGGGLFSCSGALVGIEVGNRAQEGMPNKAYFVTPHSIHKLLTGFAQ